ncbi:MAG: hypothetical protein ABI548_00510 [Polyangiaceae bacterium]
MRIRVFGAGLWCVIACSRLCHAQDTQSHALPPLAEVRHWYGWQTFTADGVAAGLFVGAVADHQNTALYGSSALVFGLGAPVVHLAHRHWEYALCSLGLRVAGPFLGALLGRQGDGETRSTDGLVENASVKYTIIGVAIGGAAASLIDGFVLAYDQGPAAAPEPERNQLLRVQAFPSLKLLPHGALLGLSGTL